MIRGRIGQMRRGAAVCALCRHRLIAQRILAPTARSLSTTNSLRQGDSHGPTASSDPTPFVPPGSGGWGAPSRTGPPGGSGWGAASFVKAPPASPLAPDENLLSPHELEQRKRLLAQKEEARKAASRPKPMTPFKHVFNPAQQGAMLERWRQEAQDRNKAARLSGGKMQAERLLAQAAKQTQSPNSETSQGVKPEGSKHQAQGPLSENAPKRSVLGIPNSSQPSQLNKVQGAQLKAQAPADKNGPVKANLSSSKPSPIELAKYTVPSRLAGADSSSLSRPTRASSAANELATSETRTMHKRPMSMPNSSTPLAPPVFSKLGVFAAKKAAPKSPRVVSSQSATPEAQPSKRKSPEGQSQDLPGEELAERGLALKQSAGRHEIEKQLAETELAGEKLAQEHSVEKDLNERQFAETKLSEAKPAEGEPKGSDPARSEPFKVEPTVTVNQSQTASSAQPSQPKASSPTTPLGWGSMAKPLGQEPPLRGPVAAWGAMAKKLAPEPPLKEPYAANNQTQTTTSTESPQPNASNPSKSEIWGSPTETGPDTIQKEGLDEKTSAAKDQSQTASTSGFWDQLTRKSAPKQQSSDFFDNLLKSEPSKKSASENKIPEDWGKELDDLPRQKLEDPYAVNQKRSSEPDVDEPASRPSQPSTEVKGRREREKGRSRRQYDLEEEDNYEAPQRKGGKRSQKKGAKSGRGSGSRYEDEDEMDEGLDEYEEYLDRQRLKAERKAQREAERMGPIPIKLPELITISNLASALKVEPVLFLEQLEELGFENITQDSIMAGETAALVAQEYGFEPTVEIGVDRDLKPRPPAEDPSVLPQRPPVVTIMGHVDHGKTTLLDFLRKSSIAAQEHGGITQHIGAFSVKMSTGKQITFLDTPGHAAFLTMRQRGANVTDIVVLVVAADDSVKPQTLEALKHAQGAKVPIIVAINKVDKDTARIEQVKNDLGRHGVELEDFGGDVQVVCVSGKTGQGMDELEENIVTLAEILDMRAETDGPAEGWILESSLKASGKVATVLVRRGTMRTGDIITAGTTFAKIRHLRNEAGALINEAGPGTAVEIYGWRELPAAGDEVIEAPDEGRARTAIEYREGLREQEQAAADHAAIAGVRSAQEEQRRRIVQNAREEVRDMARGRFAARKAIIMREAKLAAEQAEQAELDTGGPKLINFAVKGDVHGSVEAVCASIQEVGNHEVTPRILRSGTGPITEFDVEHASMSGSVIVNFATTTPSHIKRLAEEQGVKILDHTVIYHLVDDVKKTLSTYLAPEISSKVLGEAEVLQIFPLNLKGRTYKNIAGCRVRNGTVAIGSLYRIYRGGEKIFDGKLETLKHLKKEVTEMRKGTECGMGFENFQDLEEGDLVQAYEEIRTARNL